MPAADSNALLSVNDLATEFATDDGVVRPVDDVSFDLRPGEVTALVGESGCGKSATALSIMRLIRPPGRIVAGSVWFEGRDLLTLSEEDMRKLRGDRLAMIFQEPMTSLNPTMRVGDQVAEALLTHRHTSPRDALDAAVAAMHSVGMAAAKRRARAYPHELSGGQRQRVMIAMALVCQPTMLIADEPTTALDVTIQAQVLELLRRLCDERGVAVLLITHDLGVVAETADRVVVMYAGRVVESGDARSIFDAPLHPYLAALLQSAPRLDDRNRRLRTIEGSVPNLLDLPPGCRYASRCDRVDDECRTQEPRLLDVGDGRRCACWKVERR